MDPSDAVPVASSKPPSQDKDPSIGLREVTADGSDETSASRGRGGGAHPGRGNAGATKTAVKKKSAAPAVSPSPASVQLVVQRFRWCRLLLNDAEWVQVGQQQDEDGGGVLSEQGGKTEGERGGDQREEDHDHENDQPLSGRDRDDHRRPRRRHCGLLVYVSFYRGATADHVREAAETVLNLPVLTEGAWGDGVSSTESVLQRLGLDEPRKTADCDDPKAPPPASVTTSIVLVPQANLICKAKKHGKSLQYHGQAAFGRGRELYRRFAHEVRCRVLERCCEEPGVEVPEWYDSQEVQASRKDIDEGQEKEKEAEAERRCQEQLVNSFLEDHGCRIVAGTFGTRQGLGFESDMGPFCHVVTI